MIICVYIVSLIYFLMFLIRIQNNHINFVIIVSCQLCYSCHFIFQTEPNKAPNSPYLWLNSDNQLMNITSLMSCTNVLRKALTSQLQWTQLCVAHLRSQLMIFFINHGQSAACRILWMVYKWKIILNFFNSVDW